MGFSSIHDGKNGVSEEVAALDQELCVFNSFFYLVEWVIERLFQKFSWSSTRRSFISYAFCYSCRSVERFIGGAKQRQLISGLAIVGGFLEVTHLQFADDTVIFCDASLNQVETLKFILKWFERLSGLKINYGKCELIGVQLTDSHVVSLENAFGCRAGELPSKYLGLTLYVGSSKKHLWDAVVERIDKRLSSWKGRYLSLGGRLTLIKSVLSSIPIYYLSCFRCPKSVVDRIEKLQQDFLWNDSIEKKKYHLVRWETVCKPLAQGGLGIRSIVKMNKALLGKWLWRVGELGHGLWKQILICKYKLTNDGW